MQFDGISNEPMTATEQAVLEQHVSHGQVPFDRASRDADDFSTP